MCSVITTIITVIVCFLIYFYMKRKYASQVRDLQNIIFGLNQESVKNKIDITDLKNKVLIKEKEVSNFHTKLEAMVSINKDLSEVNQELAKKIESKVSNLSATPSVTPVKKKRGRKPKKKSGGSPS